MTFSSPLDELEHWLHALHLALVQEEDRRFIVVLDRLCEKCAAVVSRDKRAPQSHLERRMKLSVRWLDLHRQVQALVQPAKPNPRVRRVGNLRVIDGGRRSPSGSERR